MAQNICEQQISEFLIEFKSRFTQMPKYAGMPGKFGYSAKINRHDVSSALRV